MHNRLVQKYVFQAEVLPPVVVGILFNLVGRYACVHLLQPLMVGLNQLVDHSSNGVIASFGNQVFLDMAGTVYAAVMVGPWWAAVVGVISNAINGGFYDAYFPFGVVNILGGLVWGYLADAWNVRARLAERRPSLRDLVSIYAAFVLAGGLVGGLGSSITHLILYPSMHHPLAHGSAYDELRRLPEFAHAHSDVALMFTGDLVRDVIDKSIVVLTGLAWVLVAPAVPLGLDPPPRGERYKADVPSLFAFTVVNSLFLLAARFGKPEIQFMPSDKVIDWLHYPLVIAWLYVPIALALLSFLLLTYDSDTPYGRQVDARRLTRERFYRELTPPTPWVFAQNEIDHRMAQGRKVYGLIGSVAFWPIGKDMNTAISVTVYFGVVSLAILAYFYQNQKFVARYRNASQHIATLHDWMDLTNVETTAQFLALLIDRVAGGLRGSASSLRVAGHLVYQLIYVPHNSGIGPGKTTTFAAATGGRTVLFGVVTGGKVIDASVRQDVDRLLDAISPDTVHLVSLTAGGNDPELSAWLRGVERRDIEVGLLNWHDVEDVIGADKHIEAAQVLVKARLRTFDLISEGNSIIPPLAGTKERIDPAALAARALPSLAHVIDHLAPGATVFDLGAGRGRHTVYALSAGHRVIAVERKEATLADLRLVIAALGKLGAHATVIGGDFGDLILTEQDAGDLVIATGVLQHAKTMGELASRLNILGELAAAPCARIYIEMLIGMEFDGKPPQDGRIDIDVPGFEAALSRAYPAPGWTIERVAGPTPRLQDFSAGPRSFLPVSATVKLTAVEYLITRRD